jgi:putative ABC transport system permease protein
MTGTGSGSAHTRRRPPSGSYVVLPSTSAATLALAVAVAVVAALVVGVRGGAFVSRLGLPADGAPTWGEAWSGAVATGAAATAADLNERVLVVAAALGSLVALALLAALLRTLGAREESRPSLAVRWALGAATGRLVQERVAAIWRAVWLATLGGCLAGTGLAGAVLFTWPVGPVAGEASGSPPLLLVLVPLLPALVVAAALWPVVGLEARVGVLLRAGSGLTDDPRAGTVRRAAATAQMATAFALLLTGVSLVGGREVDGPRASRTGSDSLLVPLQPLVAGLDWGAVEQRLGATAPESLSTVGAWTGRGVRDLVTVECGECSRGGLPLPFYGVYTTLHAVSPGFFEAAGMALVAGRSFGAEDRRGSGPVGVVTRAFARDHFENGDPLGHRILLSGPGQRWVTVVGVVEPLPFRAPGTPHPDGPVLYLALAQQAAERVEWAVLPNGADDEVAPLPPGLPVAVAATPERVSERRERARAPVRWSGRLLLLSGLAGVLVTLVGAAATSAAEVRGRWREAAVRASLGASPGSLSRRSWW